MIIDKNIVSNEIGKILQNARPQNFRFEQVSEVEVLKAVKSIKTNANASKQQYNGLEIIQTN